MGGLENCDLKSLTNGDVLSSSLLDELFKTTKWMMAHIGVVGAEKNCIMNGIQVQGGVHIQPGSPKYESTNARVNP